MMTPRYFHFYDRPEFDARYGSDPGFTERCDRVAVQLYELLRREVGFLRQVPGDCLSTSISDLCCCAGYLIDSIPHENSTLETSCVAEAPQLAKLVQWFREYNLFPRNAQDRLGALWGYITEGVAADQIGVAS